MLRPTSFDPLLDRRTDDRPRLRPAQTRPAHRPPGHELRRIVGHALIAAGRFVAAETGPVRSPRRRRAY